MGRIQEGGQFAALEVEQLDAAVAVHIAAHHGLARRGVGVEVDVTLTPAEVVLDAHRIVGDEGLQDGRVVLVREYSMAVIVVGKVN